MADAVLTLRMNPKTGEKTLVISYESESDMMPFEHEDDHRAFVERLLGQSIDGLADRMEIRRTPPHPLIKADQATHLSENSLDDPQRVRVKN